MPVIMPDDVQVLLNNISAGFKESVPDVIVTSLLVVLFVGGLASYAARRRRVEEEGRIERAESRYDSLLRSLELPAGATVLLDRLARYLKEPDMRYLLLEREGTFNSCLRKLLAREPVSPALVTALRLKLGYRAINPEKRPLTSGDIVEESVVLLERPAKSGSAQERLAARVTAVEPGFLSLEVRRPRQLARGAPLTLYFYNNAGLYRLTTRVLDEAGGVVRVAHSDSITSVQRRRYYRRKLSGPAYIRRVDGEEHFFKSLLQDLGGGGARLVNPHNLFEIGDSVEVAISPALGRWIRVPAEVVRTGRDGTISVRFSELRESTRDLILRALFRRYNAYQRDRAEEGLPP